MFFAMMVMFFIFMRVAHRGRRRHYAFRAYSGHCRSRLRTVAEPRIAVAAPKPNAFDTLKQRYVDGDIDVEQYEDELDALLRVPENRKIVP
jgi:hypothetical protein